MKNKINILVSVLMLFVPQTLFAAPQIEFTPSISISEQYDDNIYLDKTDKKDDWITYFSPGLSLSFSSQKSNFILNYSPSIVRYKEKDESDTTRHALSFSSDVALSQHLEFNMSDIYLKSDDPLEVTEDIIGVRKTRNTYQRNNGDANLRFVFGASSEFVMGYRHSWLENEDVTIEDGTISAPYAAYTYWFNVKHGLEINAGYTDAEFSRDDYSPAAVETGDPSGEIYADLYNPDYGYISNDTYSGFNEGIGYRYRFNPHSVLLIDFDLTSRDFEGSTADYEVYEGSVGFEKDVSEDMSYNISAGYFVRQNDMDENDGGLNANISFTKNFSRGSFTLAGRSGWGEAYLESETRGFTKYRSVTSTFNYQVTEKINNYVSASYRHDKDESSRKSETIRANYGWSLSFLRNCSAAVDYSFAVRDDDLENDEYLVNRIMLRLRWSKPYR